MQSRGQRIHIDRQ